MKIVYIAPNRLADRAAGSRHVLDACRHWAGQGHDVTLFAPRSGPAPEPQGAVRLVRVPALPGHPLLRSLSFYLLLNAWLGSHLLTHAVDVVYTRASFLNPLAFVCLRCLFSFLYVGEANGLRSLETGRGRGVARAVAAMERLTFRSLDAAFAVTPELRKCLVDRFGMHADLVTVAPNGVDVDVFQPQSREAALATLGLDPGWRYVGFVGTMRPWHGVPDLVRAFAAFAKGCDDVALMLVGDGPERRVAEAAAAECGVASRVVFAGEQPREAVPNYIAASCFCVVPTIGSFVATTGLAPLKLFEYLACGRGVLMADLGASTAFIPPARCGLLYRMGDVHDMAAQMARMLEPGVADELGRNGRRVAVERYSWRRLTARMARTIEEWVAQ